MTLDNSDAARQSAAMELHRCALACLESLRARTDPATIEAVAGNSPQLALGLEMRAAAPTLLLMAKAQGEFLPQQVLRIEVGAFTADEVKLASVAAAVAQMLLREVSAEVRNHAIALLKASNAHLSLYILPQPFEASLELHAGLEVSELARIANEGGNAPLQ
jgi:hypothetical protein